MRSKKFACIALAVMVSLTLWGCGSNRDTGGSTTTPELSFGTDPVTGYSRVGAGTCIGCHEDFSWSADIVQGYLQGKHVMHSTHNNAGSGDYCLGCHDPIGDGKTIEPALRAFLDANPDLLAAYEAANNGDYPIPPAGLAAIGCENCHGAGGQHYGVGPIPDPNPDYTVCGKCHATLPDSHLGFHQEGNNIITNYENSRHKTASIRNEAVCAKCHTDEGGRLYKDVHTKASLFGQVLPVPTASPIQCRTCHDPHNAGQLLLPEQESHGHVTASAQYATCTTCHQGADTPVVDVIDTTTGAVTQEGLIYHSDRYMRVITDTHWDDPTTAGILEGYTMDFTNEHVCLDCHDVHSVQEINASTPTSTINDQWSLSGHAGRIGEIKQAVAQTYADMVPSQDRTEAQTAAIKAAGTTAVWSGHGWPTDGEAGCQRCHTATGLKNFLNGPDAYYTAMDAFLADQDLATPTGVPNPNDFSYLQGSQQEMLFCWACHAHNDGELRNAGKPMPLQDRNGVIFATIPDIGKATVCVACHGGRGNTQTIIDSSRSSRFQGHHAPVGGSVFNEITHTGYEFAGLDYTNASYLHRTIGLNGDSPESGAGPCVSCHMPGKDHSFDAAEYDATTGALTAIKAQTLCNGCHGSSITPAALIERKAGQADAVAALSDYIYQTNGIVNYLNQNIRTDYATVPLDAYGAFQNFNYMNGEDPCAYVHNSRYARRLIFDSIDFLDNGVLNGTITLDPTLHLNGIVWLGGDAATGVVSRP